LNERMRKAREAFEAGKFNEALLLYREEIDSVPSEVLAHLGEAFCLYKVGSVDEAISASYRALEIDPNLAIAHVILAEAFADRNEIKKSRDEARIAYGLDPNSPDILASYGSFMLIDNLLDEGVLVLEELLQIAPDHYIAHRNLATIYAQKRNYKKALEHTKALRRLRPSFLNNLRIIIAYMSMLHLFKILGVISFLLAIGGVLFRSWALLAVSISYALLILLAGIYVKVKSRGR
jgi:tetratricopeptide (TPR) repeat protein